MREGRKSRCGYVQNILTSLGSYMIRKSQCHTLGSWVNNFFCEGNKVLFTLKISNKSRSCPVTLLHTTTAALPVKQAFLNWDVSMISTFLSTFHFLSLSLGNKQRFPFISITSTLQVQGGPTPTSVIKYRMLT